MSYLKGDKMGALKGIFGVVKKAAGSNSGAEAYARETRTSPADVISFSGCKDSQTSADTVEAGQSTGAMSYVCIVFLTHEREISDNRVAFQAFMDALCEFMPMHFV